jgi:hypothetical protein
MLSRSPVLEAEDEALGEQMFKDSDDLIHTTTTTRLGILRKLEPVLAMEDIDGQLKENPR